MGVRTSAFEFWGNTVQSIPELKEFSGLPGAKCLEPWLCVGRQRRSRARGGRASWFPTSFLLAGFLCLLHFGLEPASSALWLTPHFTASRSPISCLARVLKPHAQLPAPCGWEWGCVFAYAAQSSLQIPLECSRVSFLGSKLQTKGCGRLSPPRSPKVGQVRVAPLLTLSLPSSPDILRHLVV